MPRSKTSRSISQSNHLLTALPSQECQRLLAHCEPVSFDLKEILHSPGQAISYVYFPGTAVFSLLVSLQDGTTIEVGLVGREGMVGLPVLLGSPYAFSRCVVQVPGAALRIPAGVFRTLVDREASLHRLLDLYTYAFLAQVSQSLACNSKHPITQRCCRWLLLTRSRVGADHFPMTHEFLAEMLGIRRASVSQVARVLQNRGLIRYNRGHLTILDPAGLEAATCECYRIIQAEYERLF